MRMMARSDGTSVPWWILREFACCGHMAPYDVITHTLTFPTCSAFIPFAAPVIHLASLVHLAMAFILENLSAHCVFCRHPSPVGGTCPPACAVPSEHTQTGRRCSILGCLETLLGFHFTQTSFCHLNSCFPSHAADFQRSSLNSDYSFCLKHSWLCSALIPRLRQRMRCRRGTSRGCSSRPRPSISSPSDSSEEDVDRSLHLDSGRQRGRSFPPGSSHFVPTSQPPPPVSQPASPASNFPTNPALRHSSQRAEFCFNCSLNKPVLTAFITVTICEESPIPAPAPVPRPTPIPPDP